MKKTIHIKEPIGLALEIISKKRGENYNSTVNQIIYMGIRDHYSRELTEAVKQSADVRSKKLLSSIYPPKKRGGTGKSSKEGTRVKNKIEYGH